jgi:hypothetical protein
MTSEARAALIEKAVKAAGSIRMIDANGTEYAKAVLAAAIDVALEEAAKVATEYRHPNMAFYPPSVGIAAAIRAMKGNATSPESGAPDARRSRATR